MSFSYHSRNDLPWKRNSFTFLGGHRTDQVLAPFLPHEDVIAVVISYVHQMCAALGKATQILQSAHKVKSPDTHLGFSQQEDQISIILASVPCWTQNFAIWINRDQLDEDLERSWPDLKQFGSEILHVGERVRNLEWHCEDGLTNLFPTHFQAIDYFYKTRQIDHDHLAEKAKRYLDCPECLPHLLRYILIDIVYNLSKKAYQREVIMAFLEFAHELLPRFCDKEISKLGNTSHETQ